ncbi:hypothetical protein F0248_09585 [Vibrio crassostreae]|nr:hypothetical protein [Vibrio crassostreae]
MYLVILSKYSSTKHKTILAEPFGQLLWFISTALSAFHVDQLHVKASSLYKFHTRCCKTQLERSTALTNRTK